MAYHTIYIHLPYCAAKCPYCDFNSTVTPNPPFAKYRTALAAEWQQLMDYVEAPPKTVYIGGGTPSIWPADIIVEILSSLNWSRDAEITVEINPGSVTKVWLETLYAAGVNRVSVGVQALDEHRLTQLGRRHTVHDALLALEMTLSVGFNSVSGDIIYGTLGHTPDALRRELVRLADTGVHHISAYELTIAPNTPFGNRLAEGGQCTVNEETMAALWRIAKETLKEKEIYMYEVSNYARAFHTSRHNRQYWRGGAYVGLGAGAHGFIKTGDSLIRYHNTKSPDTYMASCFGLSSGLAKFNNESFRTVEYLSRLDHAREKVMLGLRTVYGFSFDDLIRGIPEPEQKKWVRAAELIINGGWGILSEGRIIPTEAGLLHADTIAAEFF